jgi:GNAT superfamily N-acetyltransferase
LVVLRGVTIRGFVTIGSCRDEGPPKGELLALYVDPSHWGEGLGQHLIAEGRWRLARRRFTEAMLWVLVGNERAERFYHADGWVSDGGRRRVEIWSVIADEVRCRRALP